MLGVIRCHTLRGLVCPFCLFPSSIHIVTGAFFNVAIPFARYTPLSTVNEMRSNDELSSILVWKKTQILDFGCPTYIFYRKKNTLVRYIPFQKKNGPSGLALFQPPEPGTKWSILLRLNHPSGWWSQGGIRRNHRSIFRGKKFFHLHGNVETQKKNGDGGILEKGAGGKAKKMEEKQTISDEHVLFSTGLIFVVGGICYCIWWQIWQGVQHGYLKRNPVGHHYRKEVNVLGGIPLNSGLVQVCSGLYMCVYITCKCYCWVFKKCEMLFIGSLSPLFTGSFIDPRWLAGYLPSTVFLTFLHQETVQLQLFDEALAALQDET